MMEGGVCELGSAGSFLGRRRPVGHVTSCGMRSRTMRRLVGAGCRQVQADLRLHLDHRAAILMRRKRSVSNWATAKLESFGIEARKPHIIQ